MDTGLHKVIVRMVASNSEKTVGRAIESMLNQTHTNLEVHVIIRGSTDSTADIVNSYAEKDPRVRAIINKDNWIFEPGNDILDYYNEYDIGRDYVCFMDGDDEYKPDFMEDMLAFAEKNNLDIASCGNDIVDTRTGDVRPWRKTDDILLVSGDAFGELFPVYHQFVRTRWAKIVRLSLLDKVDRSRVFWLYYCDDTVEVLEYYRNAGHVGMYPGTYYKWYQDSSSVSYRWDDRRIEANRVLFDLTERYLIDKIGYISAENYEFLAGMYFASILDTVNVATMADLPVSKALAVLHDILTSRHTLKLAEYSTTLYGLAGYKERSIVYMKTLKWLTLKEAEVKAVASADEKMVAELRAALGVLGNENPGAGTVAAWVVGNEGASSVLEISGFSECGVWSVECGANLIIDRVDLADSGAFEVCSHNGDKPYNNIFGSEVLFNIESLEEYDVIVIFHLFENTERGAANVMLEKLLKKARKQVLVLTPEFPYDLEADEERVSEVRAYYPTFFAGMDFSFKMMKLQEGMMQVYSFFRDSVELGVRSEELGVRSNVSLREPSELGVELRDEPLNIAYIGPHSTEGTDSGVVFDDYALIRQLEKRGHSVRVYDRGGYDELGVRNEKCGVNGRQKIVVPKGSDYVDYIDDDVIVLTNGGDVLALEEEFSRKPEKRIPVVLPEHGIPPLFGDYGRLVSSDAKERERLRQIYSSEQVHLLAVTDLVRQALGVYGREAHLISPSVDTELFCPMPSKNNDIPTVLITYTRISEAETLALTNAMGALAAVFELGVNFKVQIVTKYNFTPAVQYGFVVEKHVLPTQEELAGLYANADIFLSCSFFEPFIQEPLLAMASGTAVVAADCDGVASYAVAGENCILFEQGDMNSLILALKILMKDREAREKLGVAGRETALRFSVESVAGEIEECLRDIVGG